jgi:hypothetical protein
MEEDEKPLPLEYGSPTTPQSPEPDEIEVASPVLWVAGGLMVAALLVALLGFLLRGLGFWSDQTRVAIDLSCFGLFGSSVVTGMYAIYRAISQQFNKK